MFFQHVRLLDFLLSRTLTEGASPSGLPSRVVPRRWFQEGREGDEGAIVRCDRCPPPIRQGPNGKDTIDMVMWRSRF
jgi:hypothetical protein